MIQEFGTMALGRSWAPNTALMNLPCGDSSLKGNIALLSLTCKHTCKLKQAPGERLWIWVLIPSAPGCEVALDFPAPDSNLPSFQGPDSCSPCLWAWERRHSISWESTLGLSNRHLVSFLGLWHLWLSLALLHPQAPLPC